MQSIIKKIKNDSHTINKLITNINILLKLDKEESILSEFDPSISSNINKINIETLEIYQCKLDNFISTNDLSSVVVDENNANPDYVKMIESFQYPEIFSKKDLEYEFKSRWEENHECLESDINYLNKLIERVLQYNYFDTFINQYRTLYKLRFIKDSSRNLVVIGRNGSGKTKFINSFRNHDFKNVYSIQANKVLDYTEHNMQRIPKYNDLKKIFLNKYRDSGKKIGHEEKFTDLDIILKYYEKKSLQGNFDEGLSDLTQIFQSIFEELQILFDKTEEKFYIYHKVHKTTYEINQLSSGEKSSLFFLCFFLLIQDNGIFLIDEPEINLNPAQSKILWDKIESTKPFSNFIYATHDKEFALSREDSNFLWNKEYEYPDNFNQVLINRDEVNGNLVFDLVGSTLPKLFIEGDYNSLDYSFYKKFYKNKYQIIPLGGHSQVIEATKSMKKVSAIGEQFDIVAHIDSDNKPINYLKGQLKKHNIFALKHTAIESTIIFLYLTFYERFNKAIIEKESLKTIINEKYEEEKIKLIDERLRQEFTYNILKFNHQNLFESQFKEKINMESLLEKKDGIEIKYNEHEGCSSRLGWLNMKNFIKKNDLKLMMNQFDEHGIFEEELNIFISGE